MVRTEEEKGTDTVMTLTDWMQDCTSCMDLARALKDVQESGEFPIREFTEFQQHLVAEHLGLVPGYVEDCPNCQEWKWTDAHPESLEHAPSLFPLLKRENLLHRAGHLIFPMEAPQASKG